MDRNDRLPAIPLIVNDPYFSIWAPSDTVSGVETIHWSGESKYIYGDITVDNKPYSFFGARTRAARQVSLTVTPTKTISVTDCGGVRLTTTFWTPFIPDDYDIISAGISFVDFSVVSTDGKKHNVKLNFHACSHLTYNTPNIPSMVYDMFSKDDCLISYVGRANQNILNHSGDRLTIDWGYLYMATDKTDSQTITADSKVLSYSTAFEASDNPTNSHIVLGYDDVASINYFGAFCKPWYTRDGKNIADMISLALKNREEYFRKCTELDSEIIEKALAIGGEDYRLIVSASWRQAFGAHKLIVTPDGEPVFVSKENDSGGYIGTVDVSYPSTPIFLKYCPELVNALCRPILKFADMDVWNFDFAPHDVGQYPHALGQAYGSKKPPEFAQVGLPVYMYPKDSDIYDEKWQMPIEESANMLIMLESAMTYGASSDLALKNLPKLEKWAEYIYKYGENPAEQLCTDDFGGHLANNVNLAAKAFIGIACYARIVKRFGMDKESDLWAERSKELTESWLKRAMADNVSILAFGNGGWSLKYNLVWDTVLELNLLPKSFYKNETENYIKFSNKYGCPLDSRATYTKSDWIMWCASMAQTSDTFKKLIKPVADYLKESNTHVPFSDWYDTKSGNYVRFTARSVQGGVFMPFLAFDK